MLRQIPGHDTVGLFGVPLFVCVANPSCSTIECSESHVLRIPSSVTVHTISLVSVVPSCSSSVYFFRSEISLHTQEVRSNLSIVLNLNICIPSSSISYNHPGSDLSFTIVSLCSSLVTPASHSLRNRSRYAVNICRILLWAQP